MIKRTVIGVHNKIVARKFKCAKGGYAYRVLGQNFRKDYIQHKLSYGKIYKIHKKGFVVDDWCFLGLNNKNYKEYLSNAQYYKMHPINGSYSKWIDDKLTLKYLCSGTEMDKYMPEYYYLIDNKGKLHRLMDVEENQDTVAVNELIDFLKKKGMLAFKLIAGSIGAGFIKAECCDGEYFLNGKKLSRDELCHKISELKSYIVTEYLKPNIAFAKFCPNTVNCLRYLVGSIDGKLCFLKGYIRFGTIKSGFVENYNAGGVLCYIDENGNFFKGNVIDFEKNRNIIVHEHPDSKIQLNGSVPMWDDIKKAVETFGKHFPQMKYLGFDFVVTDDDRVKILEINSLTSLDGFQLDGSIFNTSAGDFFRDLM